MFSHKYSSLDELIIDLTLVKRFLAASYSEVRFVKPNSLDGWWGKINECVIMVDILWGISERINLESNHYKLEMNFPVLLNKTTVKISYDSSNYKLIVNCGSYVSESISRLSGRYYLSISERMRCIAMIYENYLLELVKQMKKEMPKARYDDVISRSEIPENRL